MNKAMKGNPRTFIPVFLAKRTYIAGIMAIWYLPEWFQCPSDGGVVIRAEINLRSIHDSLKKATICGYSREESMYQSLGEVFFPIVADAGLSMGNHRCGAMVGERA